MSRTWLAVVVATGIVATSCSGADDDRAAPASTTTSTSTTLVDGEGAADAGDPYFPGLGNGGYDVVSYDLAVDVDPEGATLAGVATIEATATQELDAFNLDLVGLTASAVVVDGEPASTSHVDRELRVEPATPIAAAAPFSIEVTYGGLPHPLDSGVGVMPDVGWFSLGEEGSYVLSEPSGAATWFPGNDHPSDKATYTFHVTVPEGMEAAANGRLESSETRAGRTTWTWVSDDPMATYLAIVVVGELTLGDPQSVGPVVVRNVYADSVLDRVGSTFDRQAEMLSYFAEEFGPYPFDEYGVVVVDHELYVALETQTLSLFGSDTLGGGELLVAHELAHQWFGNSVSVANWQEIWLNEGLATWAEWRWADHRGLRSVDESAAEAHAYLDEEDLGGLPPADPGREQLFAPSVYQRGALALYAIRAQVGDDVVATILRRWVERFSGQAATTADFIAVAEDVSGEQLDELLDEWLYATELPPLP